MTTTQLDDPTVRTEDRETHLIYRTEDGRIAVTTVRYGPEAAAGPIKMRVSVWHSRETTVTDFRMVVRNRDPQAPPPEMYLSAPGGELPPVHFARFSGGGRGFTIPNVGEIGEGTVTLDWYLRSFDDTGSIELDVDVGYTLDAGLLRSYDVEGRAVLDIPQ
ncbi:MAG: hypothetical protein ABEI31_00050 [Halodesulfurarchaeum sp.]